MGFSENYFLRYKSYPRIFEDIPFTGLDAIIVIPCYDDGFIFDTLVSLERSLTGNINIEVIVIVNSGENSDPEIAEINKSIFNGLNILKNSGNYSFKLLPAIFENIPRKEAGVGNARKLGMDEAIRRFTDIDKPDGIIISLDADCLVNIDYLKLIIDVFRSDASLNGLVIQYQHDFDKLRYTAETIEACKLYEIYLRYFRLALKMTGFPDYFHTIGSCFAVKANSYVRVGGISRRKGGEDFYFLHKLAQMGGVGQITKPVVYPSPRISERVPFGTGPTVKNIIKDKQYKVYNFNLFFILQEFYNHFELINSNEKYLMDNIPFEILDFVGKNKLIDIISECENNSQGKQNFIKRLYSKFDAFFIIKFLNSFNEESKYPPSDVLKAAKYLLEFYEVNPVDYSIEGIYNDIFNLDIQIS